MAQTAARFFLGALVISSLLAVFAVTLTATHGEAAHATGCAVNVGNTSLCMMSLSDIRTLVDTLSQGQPLAYFSILLLAPVVLIDVRILLPHSRQRYRLRKPSTAAPIALYVRLFASGILNPKAP